jgi:hypothetical protein
VLLASIVNVVAPATTPATFSDRPTIVYVVGSRSSVMSLTTNRPVPSPDNSNVDVSENVLKVADAGNTDSVAVDVNRIKSKSYCTRSGSDSTAWPVEYPQFDAYNDRTRLPTTGPTDQNTVPGDPAPLPPVPPHTLVVSVAKFVDTASPMRPPLPEPP